MRKNIRAKLPRVRTRIPFHRVALTLSETSISIRINTVKESTGRQAGRQGFPRVLSFLFLTFSLHNAAKARTLFKQLAYLGRKNGKFSLRKADS